MARSHRAGEEYPTAETLIGNLPVVLRALCDHLLSGEATALDGKTLRGSFDRFQDQRALQILSALTTDRTLILGHVLIGAAGKSHEIPAAQQLINELGQSGRLFTLDALHCQKKRLNPSSPPATT